MKVEQWARSGAEFSHNLGNTPRQTFAVQTAANAWLNGASSDGFYDADAAMNGSVTLAANVTPRSVLVNNTAARAFTIGGAAIAGSGTFIKSGTGTVTLNGGVLKMFSAGNATHAGTLPNMLHVAGSAHLEVAPRCGFSGDVSGAGTLDYRTNYVRADITGDWSAFTGQLNVITAGSGDFRIAVSYAWPGLPSASVSLAANTYIYMSGTLNAGAGTTISIGALSGASGSHLRGGPTGDRTLTYRIGGIGTNATYSGNITEQNTGTTTNLVKNGAGIWNLGGPATHRGDTTVEAGTLCILIGGSITNTASLDVQSGATFCVNGGSVSVETVTIASGAAFTSNGGTATITSGTLSITGNIANTGTLRVTGGGQLATNGTFSNSGILDLLTSASDLPANFVNTGIVIENSERRILTSEKSGANFSVTVTGHAGHTYQLQRADTLGGAWTNIGPALPGTGAILTLTDTVGATTAARFNRVLVSP